MKIFSKINGDIVGGVIVFIFLCLMVLAAFMEANDRHEHKLDIVNITTADGTNGLVLFGFGGASSNGKIYVYAKVNENTIRCFEMDTEYCSFVLSRKASITYHCKDRHCKGKQYPESIHWSNVGSTIYISEDLIKSIQK